MPSLEKLTSCVQKQTFGANVPPQPDPVFTKNTTIWNIGVPMPQEGMTEGLTAVRRPAEERGAIMTL